MPTSDLNDVAVFVKVVDVRSFRAAAQALGMSKSTVSLKVAQLEDRLGARLLERTTRTLRLTEAGSAFYNQVQPALAAMHDAERVVSDMQAQPSGRLRIASLVEPGQFTLGDVVSEFMRRYPAVHVDVELTDRFVDLIEEGFDLAVRPGPLPDSTLMTRKLGLPQSLRVYASPAYLRRRGTPRRPEDLTSHDCLLMSSKHPPSTWHFRDKRKTVAVEVKERMRINSFVVLRELAIAGHGVTRLPELFAVQAARAGKLREVLDDFHMPPVEWHALYPSARNVAPKVRAFLEVLEERFAVSIEGIPAGR